MSKGEHFIDKLILFNIVYASDVYMLYIIPILTLYPIMYVYIQVFWSFCRKYQIEYQNSNVLNMVDYSSLPSLTDIPASNPPSVCSLTGSSSGEVSCSTEPLSDLSVEDILGPPNDTSNDSASHSQHFQLDQYLQSCFPSLPSGSNVTEDISEILLH